MSSAFSGIDLDDLIARYEAGASPNELGRLFGVSSRTIQRVLRAAGVPLRDKRAAGELRRGKPNPRRLRSDIDRDAVTRQYEAGASLTELALAWNCSPRTIAYILKARGVEPRDAHTARRLQISRQKSNEEQPAADATPAVAEQRESAAETAPERTPAETPILPIEINLRRMLESRGRAPAARIQEGPYTIDIAIDRVGVELLSGWWHASKRNAGRTRYLLDRGWHLVFVWVSPRRQPLTEAAVDYILEFADEIERAENPPGQYRLIWGTGEEVSRGSADMDPLPGLPE
jgi:hypothetical protein